MKLETRDGVAFAVLGLCALALGLGAAGLAPPDWMRPPLATGFSVVLGYYFVDSARRGPP